MEAVRYEKKAERWGIWEITVQGPSEGNPFTEQSISVELCSKNEKKSVDGFYDGEGIYKARFMPSFAELYEFRLTSSFGVEEQGVFEVSAPSEGNHGPVRVAGTYHFAYEDGTPYYSIGTTCYVWELQSDERIRETLASLKEAKFNKIRFCIFPKHYAYNFEDPRSFPYEGMPMDYRVLTDDNFNEYTEVSEGNEWDFSRFNPKHFAHIEKCIQELAYLGVEADIIVMHPYDRWGFSCMTKEQDALYWKYVVARFAAYRNVWWSLANEYDLMKHKTLDDWESYAKILCEKDPYNHLRSIHNCHGFYDYNRPWVTHCSIQRQESYLSAEYVTKWRETYKKPIVLDEICYEGNLQFGWGNISGKELLRRFWEGSVRGGYAGHGETLLNPALTKVSSSQNILWWSHGGKLKGESWKRFGFLYDILCETPGHGLAPYDLKWDCVCGVPEYEWMRKVKSYYLIYYGFTIPLFKEFYFDDTTEFEVEVIDTWNMTVEKRGTVKGQFKVSLPGREYMAVRLWEKQQEDSTGEAK
ncbi:DUF5605 domain-containing protein [Mediterraneibacter agrestimuris]|uniref:DUF5605 domain-containing protein n=1 Tax=Mediterraneibacter agrestimuris TaxID=2941333 RepID=UPI00203F638F|nr:DUF5605 domain-containing protein [Mediterraneibacter agrestimuris]